MPLQQYAVYETTIGGYRYAGRTELRPGETAEEAVRDRLGEHLRERTPLGKLIAYGPGAERAFQNTAITAYATDLEAARAQQTAYHSIQPDRRINYETPH